jgi:hypothetical protein
MPGGDVVGRAAGNSGQHTVSRASIPGEPRSRERLDGPVAYTPRLDVMPIPFGEFYAAVFGRWGGLLSGHDWW